MSSFWKHREEAAKASTVWKIYQPSTSLQYNGISSFHYLGPLMDQVFPWGPIQPCFILQSIDYTQSMLKENVLTQE